MMSTTSMVLFDHLGRLKKYETVEEILREFYDLRLKMYEKRKAYMVGSLAGEAKKLSNQARFILEKCDGSLKVENKKKQLMIDELSRRGYDSDPVKAWKKSQAQTDEENLDGTVMEASDDEGDADSDKDFGYLMGMPMWSLTQERKEELCKKRDERQKELKKLQATSKEEMWLHDLDEFVAKLDEVEAKENQETKDNQETQQKGFKKVAGKKGMVKAETQPSAHGIRIEPRVDEELKQKAAKAAQAKVRKAGKGERDVRKKATEDLDEFDMMTDDKNLNTSLSKKLGNTPDAIMKGKKGKVKGSPEKKGKKKNPWSDSDASDVEGSDLSDAMDDVPVAPREKAGGRRAAANIKFDKYKSDESDASDGSDELFENRGGEDDPKPKAKAKPKKEPKTYDIGSSDEDSPPKKKAAPKKQTSITDSFKPTAKVVDSDSEEASGYVANGKKNGNGVTNGNGTKDSSKDEFDVSDSGSHFEGGFAKKIANKAAKAPPKKLGTSDDLFDSMMADDDKPSKPAPAKKAGNKRPGLYSDDSDGGSDFDSAPKAKKAPASKKAPAKKSFDSDDDDGLDFDEPKPKKAAPKKAAAPKAPKAEKKKAAPKKKKDSGSEDDAPKPKKAKAAPKKKKTFDSDDMSGSDFDMSNMEPARDRPGRGKKTVNYGGGNSGSESDSDF